MEIATPVCPPARNDRLIYHPRKGEYIVKKEPWRIIVALISVGFIIYMWAKKDIASIYATTPPEQLLPMVVTSAAVTLFKVILSALAVLLAKWIVGKIGKK